MTTETKVKLLGISQDISELNRKLLEAIDDSVEQEAADELISGSQKLIQAQNNILKAVK